MELVARRTLRDVIAEDNSLAIMLSREGGLDDV